MKAKFKFHGREEVLNIINTGGHLVEYLTSTSEICPLIGSEIKLIKELGKGKYGTAYLVKIDGMGEKEYVAKVNNQKCSHENIDIGDKPRALLDIAESLEDKYMIPSETFISLNGENPRKMYTRGSHKFIFPGYAKMCLTSKITKYKRFDGMGDVVIPKGSYICSTEEYSEYVIGILCGELYRKGVSINFLDVFGFASCPDENKCLSKQYVFMEKAGMSLVQFAKKNKMDDTMIEVIFVQILHAITVYQKYYKIQHNDLHLENILIEHITPDTTYKKQKLIDADWFHYKIYDTDIYLPKIEVVIKIVDFGLSMKYSKPMVGNKRSLKSGQAERKGWKPWIPNWYSESSDAVYMADDYYDTVPKNDFVRNIFGWMLGINKKQLEKEINHERKRTFTSGGDRPDISMLSGKYYHSTPSNVLRNSKLMSKYLKIPKKGKIVTLGYI